MKNSIRAILFFLPLMAGGTSHKAITIVPVADLLGKPAHVSAENNAQYYQKLPLCAKNSSSNGRIHQLLFNEIVRIEEEQGNEVRIRGNVFFQTADQVKHASYWTLKKNLVSLRSLQEKNIDVTKLPEPLSYRENRTAQSIVTLKKPYYCKSLEITFSAGTRFVAAPNPANTGTSVYALHPKKLNMHLITIPNQYVMHVPTTTQGKIESFVALTKEFAHLHDGFIPYVWGGCSYTATCRSDSFSEIKRGNTISYHRPELLQKPYTGFDCSGLICSAAQMCGIPFYFKNSFTIASQIKELTKNEQICNGDIIWIPGHVMIVSSLVDHLVIEARSYGHGYGKVQELPLSSIFKEVNSYNDLLARYHQKSSLSRLDKRGKIVQTIPQFKILKLSSVWPTK